MRNAINRATAGLQRLWQSSPALTSFGLLMVALALVTTVGLVVDDRIVTGMPVWLKPLKFAVSTAIYSFTLAWVFLAIPDWPRTRRLVGATTTAVFVLELVLIYMQAWRGTSSHFNVGTAADAAIFSVMGIAIVIQTLASITVAVALWRQPFADRALGWALRLGMTITIIGALSGGLMTRPTAAQIANARATGRMPFAGAHTVGAPDGGPGLPGTGWSREHGDLRIPHFLGLHALQVLVLLALLLRRRGADALRAAALVWVAGLAYLSLFLILIRQALSGEAIVQPGSTTMIALAVWGIATVIAASTVTMRRLPARTRAVVLLMG